MTIASIVAAIFAVIVGVAVGSIPTADILARMRGIDLRSGGSGNPGTRNALALGGKSLAISILVVELAKGAAAVLAGQGIGGDPGAALAGVGAVFGNVYNPWFGFRGGKGLAITGGTLLGGWLAFMPVLGLVLGALVAAWRRTGPASLVTFALYVVTASVGLMISLPIGFGIDSPSWRLVLAVGSVAIMSPKHLQDSR